MDVARGVLVVLALAVTLFPVYWMLVTSVKPPPEVFRSPPALVPAHPTFEAFATIFRERPMLRYVANSLIVSVGATAVSMLLGSLAAYGFTRFHVRGAMVFVIALLFTRMLPETLLIVPYFQLVSALGLIDTYLALILAYTSFSLPFALWMLIGFFRGIPLDIDEAAVVDGATRLQALVRVVLPLAGPGLVAVGFFTFIAAWNSYLWALVLTTRPEMFVISVGVANMVGEYRVQWNELMAASSIATVPVVLLFACFSRYLVAGATAGAVKG
ncbi:MAG TPA: carbohydrate ABC transporter permease [Acetobacteraceae bacterium]